MACGYVLDHMVGVESHDNGDIAALQTRSQGPIAGDLFVDCTGLQSLLLGQHYQTPFVSQKHVLFNDTALALQVPYPDDKQPDRFADDRRPRRAAVGSGTSDCPRAAASVTSTRARTFPTTRPRPSCAATWSGYRRGQANGGTPRKLTFEPGYREHFWHRNCVAIGLSAGFIEPLEASALALVELSAAMLSDQMPATREAMDIVARRFNDSFTYRWERVIDFLKLHYVLSQRTSFRLLARQRRRGHRFPSGCATCSCCGATSRPRVTTFIRIEEVFPSASYQYVLYGMGFRPEPGVATRRSDDCERADAFFREAAALTGKMLAALPSNRELIDHIQAARAAENLGRAP